MAAGMVPEAISSYLRAEDSLDFESVIKAAEEAGAYDDLIKYLIMARKKVRNEIRSNEPPNRVDVVEACYSLHTCSLEYATDRV